MAETATKERIAPVIVGTATKLDLPMPTVKTKRGSESAYPFDSLTEIGMAFGMNNKTKQQLSSIISNANRKNMQPEIDGAGNPVYHTKELVGADGTKTTVPDTSKPKMVPVKHYFAVDVDADMAKKLKGTPLAGSTVLVYRDK